jgi:hypothetical protein
MKFLIVDARLPYLVESDRKGKFMLSCVYVRSQVGDGWDDLDLLRMH